MKVGMIPSTRFGISIRKSREVVGLVRGWLTDQKIPVTISSLNTSLRISVKTQAHKQKLLDHMQQNPRLAFLTHNVPYEINVNPNLRPHKP